MHHGADRWSCRQVLNVEPDTWSGSPHITFIKFDSGIRFFPLASDFQMEFGDIDKMLSAAWLGAASVCLVAAIPSKALRPLQSLVLMCCKRGKLLYAPSNKFTVPQSWFTHFYVVGVVWNTLLLVAAILSSCTCTLSSVSQGLQFSALVEQFAGAGASASSGSIPLMVKHKQRGWTTVFLLMLMELQVCRRLYESLVVFSYSPDARMHVIGYLVGLFYYMAAPLSLCARDFGEMLVNVMGLFAIGRVRNICAMDIDFQWMHCLQYLGTLEWYQCLGGLMFLWGWIHQYRCHEILASLRSEVKPIEDEYQMYGVPHGDWFEKVSCAHYLSEIVMYVGLVLASGGGHLALWFLLSWVVLNLYLVAKETHQWYLSKFEDYPANRRALIPFLC